MMGINSALVASGSSTDRAELCSVRAEDCANFCKRPRSRVGLSQFVRSILPADPKDVWNV